MKVSLRYILLAASISVAFTGAVGSSSGSFYESALGSENGDPVNDESVLQEPSRFESSVSQLPDGLVEGGPVEEEGDDTVSRLGSGSVSSFAEHQMPSATNVASFEDEQPYDALNPASQSFMPHEGISASESADSIAPHYQDIIEQHRHEPYIKSSEEVPSGSPFADYKAIVDPSESTPLLPAGILDSAEQDDASIAKLLLANGLFPKVFKLNMALSGKRKDLLDNTISDLNDKFGGQGQFSLKKAFTPWNQLKKFVVGTNYDRKSMKATTNDFVSKLNEMYAKFATSGDMERYWEGIYRFMAPQVLSDKALFASKISSTMASNMKEVAKFYGSESSFASRWAVNTGKMFKRIAIRYSKLFAFHKMVSPLPYDALYKFEKYLDYLWKGVEDNLQVVVRKSAIKFLSDSKGQELVQKTLFLQQFAEMMNKLSALQENPDIVCYSNVFLPELIIQSHHSQAEFPELTTPQQTTVIEELNDIEQPAMSGYSKWNPRRYVKSWSSRKAEPVQQVEGGPYVQSPQEKKPGYLRQHWNKLRYYQQNKRMLEQYRQEMDALSATQ
ncbi:hypothetical protein MP228_012163 [Amoeboaphelidium protococcarum]|nr:hypothetical protein MP228_012163 [Amoeboaphelidium protococcarum]